MTSKTKIGIIGCGNISGIYLEMAQSFDILETAACADLDVARAVAQAEKYGVPRAGAVDELLADPEIDIVVNLTVPDAHAGVALASLAAGKHVYNEKPLAVRREDGRRLLQEAQARNLRVGCAPDTFLGAGLQTCRKLLDDGAIGAPVAATAFMLSRGPEGWHPNPDFFYQEGGGPLFDMGPYYLTALISLLGSVRRVTGSAQISFPERLIGSEPRRGALINVQTPTHLAAVLDFTGGPVATLVTSFDVWRGDVPRLEIYGSEGTLSLPDPNMFGGPVRLWRPETGVWQDVPLTHGRSHNSRGFGVADMAQAIRSGRPHRASGEMAFHVLDIMHAIHDASQSNQHIILESGCERPAPLPTGLPEHLIDA
jgi:predicted dehydrogenase